MKNKKLKSGPSSSNLIWNIFSWIDHFNGKVKIGSIDSKDLLVFIESKKLFYSFSLSKKQELLAANCILTWWANTGLDNNKNENGENIFDFDLTKEKNREKFTA